jgi:hypothetical protein
MLVVSADEILLLGILSLVSLLLEILPLGKAALQRCIRGSVYSGGFSRCGPAH